VCCEAYASDRKPVVDLLTNYNLPEYRVAALNLGATHLLDKALNFDRLPGLLREIRVSSALD
jgi:hypothetical protein